MMMIRLGSRPNVASRFRLVQMTWHQKSSFKVYHHSTSSGGDSNTKFQYDNSVMRATFQSRSDHIHGKLLEKIGPCSVISKCLLHIRPHRRQQSLNSSASRTSRTASPQR